MTIDPLTDVTWSTEWGKWSDWSEWSGCEGNPCKFGTKIRIRKCNTENTNLNGVCFGVFWEEDVCTLPCYSTWSAWGPWTPCPSSCGPAFRSRTRRCLHEGNRVCNIFGDRAKDFGLILVRVKLTRKRDVGVRSGVFMTAMITRLVVQLSSTPRCGVLG